MASNDHPVRCLITEVQRGRKTAPLTAAPGVDAYVLGAGVAAGAAHLFDHVKPIKRYGNPLPRLKPVTFFALFDSGYDERKWLWDLKLCLHRAHFQICLHHHLCARVHGPHSDLNEAIGAWDLGAHKHKVPA